MFRLMRVGGRCRNRGLVSLGPMTGRLKYFSSLGVKRFELCNIMVRGFGGRL